MSVLPATRALARVASREPIIRSTACTDWTRFRKALLILAVSLPVSGLRLASQAGADAGSVLNAGPRGAFRPGNAFASCGAGVDGVCGANVAISNRNGEWAAGDAATKDDPFPLTTSVR